MRILQFYANVSQIRITTDLGMVLTAECSVRNEHFSNFGFGNLWDFLFSQKRLIIINHMLVQLLADMTQSNEATGFEMVSIAFKLNVK